MDTPLILTLVAAITGCAGGLLMGLGLAGRDRLGLAASMRHRAALTAQTCPIYDQRWRTDIATAIEALPLEPDHAE